MTGSAPHWPIVVVPSFLSADFGRFVEEVRAVDAAGAKVKFFGGAVTLAGHSGAMDLQRQERRRHGTHRTQPGVVYGEPRHSE